MPEFDRGTIPVSIRTDNEAVFDSRRVRSLLAEHGVDFCPAKVGRTPQKARAKSALTAMRSIFEKVLGYVGYNFAEPGGDVSGGTGEPGGDETIPPPTGEVL